MAVDTFVQCAPHEGDLPLIFDEYGLGPYFAMDSIRKNHDGWQTEGKSPHGIKLSAMPVSGTTAILVPNARVARSTPSIPVPRYSRPGRIPVVSASISSAVGWGVGLWASGNSADTTA